MAPNVIVCDALAGVPSCVIAMMGLMSFMRLEPPSVMRHYCWVSPVVPFTTARMPLPRAYNLPTVRIVGPGATPRGVQGRVLPNTSEAFLSVPACLYSMCPFEHRDCATQEANSPPVLNCW